MQLPKSLNLPNVFINVSRAMGLLCAFGIPWSNASFNIGFYLMLIFFAPCLLQRTFWQTTFKNSTSLLALALFLAISSQTVFSTSSANLAQFDFMHYRKLLTVPIFILLFNTTTLKKQLLLSYCLGVIVLMLPTLLDGFGLLEILNIDLKRYQNEAYSSSLNGVPNLVFWRNQIVHGFHVSVLFSACLIGIIYVKKIRKPLILISILCAIDLLFFIYGRMALLSFFVAILTITLICSSSKKDIFVGLLLVVTLIFTAYLFNPAVNKRVHSISKEVGAYETKNDVSSSAGTRIHYWKISLQLFTQSPIFGTGSGSFKQYLVTSKDAHLYALHSHTHNEYLTQLSQYGAVGFSLFIALILISLIKSRSIDDPWLSKTCFVAIILFSLNAFTDSSLHNDWEGWAFILFISIASASGMRNLNNTTSF